MHDIAEFLRRHDPFSGLDEEQLERLATRVEVEYFPAGATIFPQGTRPQGKVRVVRRGSVELVDRGRVVDVLGEGELFGHPSVLSGDPTGFEARAHEDSLCYALAAGDVVPLLARPSSLPYLTRSLLRRGRPGSADEADIASAEVAQQPAAALIRRGPVFAGPDEPVREVAQLMMAEGASSVLIRDGNEQLGIVTDRDVGVRALAGGISVDAPVQAVMSTPIVTVRAEATGADVMLAMLDHDIRHVPVVSSRSEVLGVVVGIDLVAAESRTPFVLRREIAQATDENQLRQAARRLRSAVVALHRAELAPAQISRVISVVGDALIRRLIELAIESEGTPPAEFCWMALGSHGRREPVPASDVDSGMSWRGTDIESISSRAKQVISAESTARYMHSIAAHVADGIRVVGWRLDPHGVNASGSFSASSVDDWHRAIQQWVTRPDDERVLIATSVLLDGRTVLGPEELNPKPVLYRTESRSGLLHSMLRLAVARKPPTGFRRDIVVEEGREHRGTFDIKHGGLLPIVDLARYAALVAEAEVTPTVERLRAGGESGAIKPDQARVLEEAYNLFAGLRLEHQVHQLEKGAEPDDHLDPRDLNPLTRRYLRDAFREVRAVQRSLSGALAWGS
jgi:CBS domain-containing protein